MRAKRTSIQRQQIIRAVKISPRELSAEDIGRSFKPTMPKSTLYRNLEYLVKQGEIYLIEGVDGIRRYLGHTQHKAKFVCQRCGAVRRLNSLTLPDYVQRKMPGMQVVFISHLEGRGLCRACAKKMSN